MPRKKSHQEYSDELASRHDTLYVIGQYVGGSTSILHGCKICNHTWNARPVDKLSKGSGCPRCSRATPKAHDKYLTDLKSMGTTIVPVEQYVGNKRAINHQCRTCGNTWMAKPNNILAGWGCPKCSGKYTRTHQDYVKELEQKHDNFITCIDSYVGMNTYLQHHCHKCNYTWTGKPAYVLRSDGCPKCPKKYGSTDNDAIYLWKTNLTHDGVPVYKIGVTSSRLGKARIHQCSKNSGLEIEGVIRWEVTSVAATLVEQTLLGLGLGMPINDISKKDGYTELRALTSIDITQAHQIIDDYKIDRLAP